jgi:hypothetical protein
MKGKFSRTVLMIAGILTVIVILISQAFYQTAEHKLGLSDAGTPKKETSDKAGHKSHKTDKQVSIVTSDVVPSHAVQVDKNTAAVIKTFTPEERPAKAFFPVTRIFTSFFKILLRTTISPNAP